METIKHFWLPIILVLSSCVVVSRQLWKFYHVKEEYKECYKDYMSLLADYGKKIIKAQTASADQTPSSAGGTPNASNISFGGATIQEASFSNENVKPRLIKLLDNDPYEWFISYRNTKTELFKSYVVVPLELYFCIAFMISLIYTLGYGILVYIDDPLQGFGNLIEEMHTNWIGTLILLALFLHRVVLKKIEDIKKFKDAEFK